MPFGDPIHGRIRYGLLLAKVPGRPLTDDPELLSYLGFEEGSGDQASDDYTWTAALTNRISWVAGKVGKAIQFNGIVGSYLRTPYSLAFDLQNFSIAFWLYTPSDLSTNSYCLFDHQPYQRISGHWTDYGYSVWISSSPFGTIVGGVYKGTYPDVWKSIQSTTNVRGGWHHVVYTYGNRTLALYIDNVQEATDVTTWDLTYYGGLDPYIRIVSWLGGPAYFRGIIDEFYLFSKVLSASERALLYGV